MTNRKLSLALLATICLAACSSPSHLETKLLGKWQSEAGLDKAGRQTASKYQFEFFAEGSVVNDENINGHWLQMNTGSFKFIDQTHMKIDYRDGSPIYEVAWLDNDHVSLRTGDTIMRLVRLKDQR